MRTFRAAIAALLFTTITAASGAETSVLVYPSGLTVPENLLRIELRFSAPLRPPLTINQVQLTDANGVEIKDPFLDLPLISTDDKIVTILLHPGRVKSGVRANLALGRALHAGSTVILVVNHASLPKPVHKRWQVTAFDSQSPQPARWTFEVPPRDSRSPFVVHLDKPVSSSAERMIAIRGMDGERLTGEACLESGETVWRFAPARPWQPGSYALVTHPDLEDPAGNRPAVPFEASNASLVNDAQGTVQAFEVLK